MFALQEISDLEERLAVVLESWRQQRFRRVHVSKELGRDNVLRYCIVLMSKETGSTNSKLEEQ